VTSEASKDDLDALPGPPPADAAQPDSAEAVPPADDGLQGVSGQRLIRATDITGLPVVTLGGDRDVEVKDVVFDKQAGSITGFTLRKPGLLGGPQKRVLPVGGVHAVGRDAVVIRSHADFVSPEALEASGDDVIGDRVITDDGTDLGKVVDVIASFASGAADIVGFEIEASAALATEQQHVFLPLPDAGAISGEAIVVPASARDYVTNDFTGFGGSVAAFRDQLERS